MSDPIRLDIDCELYDEGAVRETVEQFRGVARITTRKSRTGVILTLSTEQADVDQVAGELLNIALARTLEARADRES